METSFQVKGFSPPMEASRTRHLKTTLGTLSPSFRGVVQEEEAIFDATNPRIKVVRFLELLWVRAGERGSSSVGIGAIYSDNCYVICINAFGVVVASGIMGMLWCASGGGWKRTLMFFLH